MQKEPDVVYTKNYHMQPSICICCGEAISLIGNSLSRNPNLCASCSSMADGMADEDCQQESAPATEPARFFRFEVARE